MENLKKKILIATPLYPPDIGGPAHYAKNLEEIWKKDGHDVCVVSFGQVLKIPTGIRHLIYFLKLIKPIKRTDNVLVLDTFSVGFPAVILGKFFRKKVVLRIGGDFLWEHFIERTSSQIKLSDFYNFENKFSFKEKIIFYITRFVLIMSDKIVFSTNWQSNIWQKAYGFSLDKVCVIGNNYQVRDLNIDTSEISDKYFLWAGRDIFLKNLDNLKNAFSIIKTKNAEIKLKIFKNINHSNLLKEIKKSYVVIIPSFSEVSPNLILEALSLGVPVIMTEDNGLNLKDNVLYVNPFDVNDIVEKVLFLSDQNNYIKYKNRISNIDLSRSYEEVANDFEKIFI